MTYLVTYFMAVTLIVTFVVSEARADYGLEFEFSEGYTGNLLLDSSNHNDTYTTAAMALNVYPGSALEANLTLGYIYYSQLFDVSNVLYGGSVTFVPTDVSSKFLVYLTGNYRGREYHGSNSNSWQFYAKDLEGLLSVGYAFSPTLRARSRVSFERNGYGHDEVGDKQTLELAVGANISLFNYGSLDIETGYSTGNYEYLDPGTGGIRLDKAYRLLRDGDLRSYYISPRISGYVGKRVGLSMTFHYRRFVDPDDAVVYGYSSGLLSPWSSVYEGEAIRANVKTFIVPGMILSGGVGFWNKSYLPTLERRLFDSPFGEGTTAVLSTIFAEERRDDEMRIFLGVMAPLLGSYGPRLKLSLQMEYVSNRSSVVVYDYSALSASVRVNVSL